MKVTVVKTGYWFVDRKLARLSGKDAKAVIRKASRAAIKPIEQQAKSNARKTGKPVHPIPIRSGKFAKIAERVEAKGLTQQSIKTRSITRSRVRVGSRVTIEDKNFPKKFYAKFQELGWKSLRGRKMKGNRPLLKSANEKKQIVLRKFKGEIKIQFVKLAKKK